MIGYAAGRGVMTSDAGGAIGIGQYCLEDLTS